MKKNILVVDNHPLIVRLMTGFLEKEGHRVVAAADGLSALEALESFTPDVIFIELVMPNISGQKLCRIIRSRPALDKAFLVVLSAIAAEENLDFAAFGADACIAKGPFKQIAGHINEMLARLDEKERTPSRGIIGLEGLYQREITKELLSSRAHFEVIINNMAEGVLELTPAGRIIFVNPAAAALLRSREESILAADFASFFADGHHARITGLLQRAVSEPIAASEDDPLFLNGRQIALQLLPLREGDSRTLIVIAADVTERKQNEKELEIHRHHLEKLVRERNADLEASNRKLREEMLTRREMEQHLRQAQKMEALSTLAGGLAHDLKNILQIILGNAELASTAPPGDPEIARGLEQILQAGGRAANLLQQILAFSRNTPPKREPVRLQEAIDETLALLAGMMPASVRVLKEIDPDSPPVLADHSQVGQVIFNLVTNAQQAMRERGGTLVLGLGELRIDSEAEALKTGLERGRYGKLTVRDSGPGMEQQVLDRIFEPYFTTKKPGEGTGLGLAAVHGIVRSHGGSILVTSKVGGGTTVEVCFPAVPPEE